MQKNAPILIICVGASNPAPARVGAEGRKQMYDPLTNLLYVEGEICPKCDATAREGDVSLPASETLPDRYCRKCELSFSIIPTTKEEKLIAFLLDYHEKKCPLPTSYKYHPEHPLFRGCNCKVRFAFDVLISDWENA